MGGITTMVIALPMSLAFGVASGLGANAGIYGAIAVGFFAAVFGGTPSQISGPTGPMTVAMAAVITGYADNLAEAFTAVVLAGFMQIGLGLLGVGRFVSYTPRSVISGFMSGIGIIIMLIQTMPFIGAEVPPGGPLSTVRAWPEAVGGINPDALAVAFFSLAVCMFWPGLLSKFCPAPLAALVFGTLLSIFWLDGVPVIGEVPMGLPSVQATAFSPGVLLGALQPAFILAMLGSLDSLLTSLVASSITHMPHDPNRELVGQGVGNLTAGIFGGLPGAGATMRTVTNIRAGGKTPLSGVLYSVALLALVMGLGQFVEPIPLAALAGILMKVGWDIIDWRFLKRAHRLQTNHLLVMLVTLGLTVCVDLITAVAIGLIVAGIVNARQLGRLELDRVISTPLLDMTFLAERQESAAEEADAYSARVGMVALRGCFSIASSNELIRLIGEDIRDHEVVIFDFTDTLYIDDSAAMVVEQLIDVAADKGTGCIVMGLHDPVADILESFDTLRRIRKDRFVANLDEARECAKKLLKI